MVRGVGGVGNSGRNELCVAAGEVMSVGVLWANKGPIVWCDEAPGDFLCCGPRGVMRRRGERRGRKREEEEVEAEGERGKRGCNGEG